MPDLARNMESFRRSSQCRMYQLAFLSSVPLWKSTAYTVPSELTGFLLASTSDTKFLTGHFFLSNDPRRSFLLERGTASASIAAWQLRSLSCLGPFSREAEGGGALCREAAVPDGFSRTCLGSRGIQPPAAEPGAEPVLQVPASTNARLGHVLPSPLLRGQQTSPSSPTCSQLLRGLPHLLLGGREPETEPLETEDYSSLAGNPSRPASVVMPSNFADDILIANELRPRRSQTTLLKAWVCD